MGLNIHYLVFRDLRKGGLILKQHMQLRRAQRCPPPASQCPPERRSSWLGAWLCPQYIRSFQWEKASSCKKATKFHKQTWEIAEVLGKLLKTSGFLFTQKKKSFLGIGIHNSTFSKSELRNDHHALPLHPSMTVFKWLPDAGVRKYGCSSFSLPCFEETQK